MKHMVFTERARNDATGFVSYDTTYVDVPVEDEIHGAPEPIIDTSADGYTVWFDWSALVTVSNPRGFGISTGSGARGLRLAYRLAEAARAGVLFEDVHKATGNDGVTTYVASSCKVMGKYLNADLKRLGF